MFPIYIAVSSIFTLFEEKKNHKSTNAMGAQIILTNCR